MAMRLEEFCVLELHYTSEFHYVSPYEGESGKGWGLGEGTATGDRLSGTVQWSKHPNGRGGSARLAPRGFGGMRTSAAR